MFSVTIIYQFANRNRNSRDNYLQSGQYLKTLGLKNSEISVLINTLQYFFKRKNMIFIKNLITF